MPARWRRVRSHCGDGPTRTLRKPRPMYRGQPPKSSTATSTASGLVTGGSSGSGSRSAPSQRAATSRASPTIESRSGRFIVGRGVQHVVDERQDVGNGVPGSSPSGRSMIPEWSVPEGRSRPRRGSSRVRPPHGAAAPRAGRGSPAEPRPGRPTATVAPAPKFHAPQTICCGSGLPTSTWQSWSRSALGCGSAASTRPTTKWPRLPSESADADLDHPLDLERRDGEAARDLRGRRRGLDVLAQPGERNAHQNCLEKRRSLRQSSRRSGNSWRSMAMRSSPHPNAKPEYRSGS